MSAPFRDTPGSEHGQLLSRRRWLSLVAFGTLTCCGFPRSSVSSPEVATQQPTAVGSAPTTVTGGDSQTPEAVSTPTAVDVPATPTRTARPTRTPTPTSPPLPSASVSITPENASEVAQLGVL